jgi:hypothetical protein
MESDVMSIEKKDLHRKILYAIKEWSKNSANECIGEGTLFTLIRFTGANEADIRSAIQDLLKSGEIYAATTERFFKVTRSGGE